MHLSSVRVCVPFDDKFEWNRIYLSAELPNIFLGQSSKNKSKYIRDVEAWTKSHKHSNLLFWNVFSGKSIEKTSDLCAETNDELVQLHIHKSSRDPFTNIPAWVNNSCNYIHYRVSGEITNPFSNFSCATIEVGNGCCYVISSHTLWGMWLLIHAGISAGLIVLTFW